jgi:hypothetical protein
MKNMNTRILYLILSITVIITACGEAKKPSPQEPVEFTDEQLLDSVQYRAFLYFWNGSDTVSGMSKERIHMDGVYPQKDQDVITSGGSGFGLMTVIAAVNRGWITRQQAVERLSKMTAFLEKADRFHGAWPHWWYDYNGKVKAFSTKDDGGDIVETSFIAQGLLVCREYFKNGNEQEKALAARMDQLWKTIDFNFYTRGGNSLYWHWSPKYQWDMNFQIRGYNECLITYLLAASSPTHPVSPKVYHQGWAMNGGIKSANTKYGYSYGLKHQDNPEYGGPLFWAHYSYLGLDPRGLKDTYADYEQETKNQVLINFKWCVENPHAYKNYGPNNWGLTASYSPSGYAAHAPGVDRDLGVITPTAAVSSIVYTPQESLRAIRNWFTNYHSKLWGEYGFYDAFSDQENWYPKHYLAIDQGPMVVMIENYRSELFWKLFMNCSEVQEGLIKLGFESPYLSGPKK